MKKYLSILVLGIALLLPLSASAATNKVEFTCGDCVDNGDVCQKTCKVAITGDSITLNSFTANLTLSEGLTLDKVTPADGWLDLSTGSSLNFTATTSVTGTNINLATVVVNVPKDAENCTIQLQPTGFENVTVDVTVDQIVSTGATLPIAIIACGMVAAFVVYAVSKKNTKMYKI